MVRMSRATANAINGPEAAATDEDAFSAISRPALSTTHPAQATPDITSNSRPDSRLHQQISTLEQVSVPVEHGDRIHYRPAWDTARPASRAIMKMTSNVT